MHGQFCCHLGSVFKADGHEKGGVAFIRDTGGMMFKKRKQIAGWEPCAVARRAGLVAPADLEGARPFCCPEVVWFKAET